MMNARSETMTSLIGVGNIVSITTCHRPSLAANVKQLYTYSDTVRSNLGTGLPSVSDGFVDLFVSYVIYHALGPVGSLARDILVEGLRLCFYISIGVII